MVEARLDGGFRFPKGGLGYHDVHIVDTYSRDPQRRHARSHKAGTAARQGVEAKRLKYPEEKHRGATLVPFVLESLGHPSEEAVQLLQTFAPQEPVARAEMLRSAYYQLSTLLAMRQAELQMSAEGAPAFAPASARRSVPQPRPAAQSADPARAGPGGAVG